MCTIRGQRGPSPYSLYQKSPYILHMLYKKCIGEIKLILSICLGIRF